MKHTTPLACMALAAVLGCDGCDEGASVAVDATSKPVDPLIDPELGLEMQIPAQWHSQVVEGAIVGAVRQSESGTKSLVAPRLFVAKRKLDGPIEIERLLAETIEQTKAALTAPAARVRRTSTSRWSVDGVEVGSFRLDYTVSDSKGGEGRDVVQRSVVAARQGPGEQWWVVEVSATFVATDDEALGMEVDGMLRSLHFSKPVSQ